MTSNTAAGTGRHRAPQSADSELRIATVTDAERVGRHAEPEWHREQFDPATDEDPLDWLGFGSDVA